LLDLRESNTDSGGLLGPFRGRSDGYGRRPSANLAAAAPSPSPLNCSDAGVIKGDTANNCDATIIG
jgi:hypothetical protein